MKYMEIHGDIILMDEEDYNFLLSFNSWYVNSIGYVVTSKMINYESTYFSMHRVVMERMLGENIPKDLVVDHKNQNKLDNRRCNLRLATKAQNSINGGLYSHNKSGFRGIGFHERRNEWRARIGTTHLGWFKTKEEAIEAREQAERLLYGEFAGVD